MKYRVGIIGATGTVGQRLVALLANHDWFTVTALAASKQSASKPYAAAIADKRTIDARLPQSIADMIVYDAQNDARSIAREVDFIFSAVDLQKEEAARLEETFARLECPVVSSNGALRHAPDVPMVIPEINPEHLSVIPFQKKRLNTKRGFVAVKSNCTLQCFVPPLHALRQYGLEKTLVCTYQSLSGAGRAFIGQSEMTDNVIPYIEGEDEKTRLEPLKIWGCVKDGAIIDAVKPDITAQCVRVPVTEGHMTVVFASFARKPEIADIIRAWKELEGEPQKLKLPSAPEQMIRYFDERNYPQTRLHRDLGKGMTISVGGLRPDRHYDIKFVGVSHNAVRGAAGGAVLLAELLCAKGYII